VHLIGLEYMRILDGRELADFVKERQAKQIRNLRQSWKTFPKLVILITGENPVIDTFVRLKQAYGEDILVDVEVKRVKQADIIQTIDELNDDESVHGIIVQLPIADPSQTDEVVRRISPDKDIDGLGTSGTFISATATAIDWLLAGYNVMLKERTIAIVGRGRLVGAPLAALWATAGLNVTTYDDTVEDLQSELRKADIIVSATGVPGLITSQMISPSKVVVDAGTASENGAIVGDIAEDVRERQDLTITPIRGGVGPLTIAALFDNLIMAATATVQKN
jgi:methylenetetrahydrofolate dehydrogenase (NADP+)/methenyltetrahydrofolate cyclohydrolase